MSNATLSETIQKKDLIDKLNPLCLQAFADARASAKARENPYVELAHFITALSDADRSDVSILLEAAGVDAHRFVGDQLKALDDLPTGAGSVAAFSDHVFRAMLEGWKFGKLAFDDEEVRSAYILLGCLKSEVLSALLFRMSLEFDKLDADGLADNLSDLLLESAEGAFGAEDTPDAGPQKSPRATGALAQYATNLTARAKAGELDPVTGRDHEIRQIIDVILRRRQNNPILTGEAGVGKTAVVEGFAERLARGDVPPALRNVELHLLDVGLMQAGASMKGEFEKRLKSVIDEVQASPVPIVLFIDEAHTLIGAGGAAGTGDAANLLKPALARGELRTIAATTWAEYKQHIEPDPALTRRFQVIRVEEPDEPAAVTMCRGVAAVLEKHHRVEILDEAIEASVALSHRYIPARQLPDKAISLLDTACARVSVSQHATPPAVEDLERRQGILGVELRIAEREAEIGIDAEARIAAIRSEAEGVEADMAAAQARWEAEKSLVDQVLELRGKLRRAGEAIDDPSQEDEAKPAETALCEEERAGLLEDLKQANRALAEAQGEMPLILPSVDAHAVAGIVQEWTGIPTGRMLSTAAERALTLSQTLSDRVVGQDHAMEMIANRLQTAAAGIGAPEKPVGVFMLCGPSGVGKTETALALADVNYGGEQSLISINMSEYQEAHTVSTLKGAPPGYVGYGKGGVLTEAVRRKPYSVVLLDEVEKAHPDVHEIFFQVFDKGMMDDSEGRRIDFKNTLILMTSNVGTDAIMRLTENGQKHADLEALNGALREALLQVFPPALLGRVVAIPYYPLSDPMIEAIAGHKLKGIEKRLATAHNAKLALGDGVMDLIKARATEVDSGGRMIDAILTNTLLPELSRAILARQLEDNPFERVTVTGSDAGFAYTFE